MLHIPPHVQIALSTGATERLVSSQVHRFRFSVVNDNAVFCKGRAVVVPDTQCAKTGYDIIFIGYSDSVAAVE